MIRPTISSSAFPYRGPKNRLDINNLLTSAKRDFNMCSDFSNYIATRQQAFLNFYTKGETTEEIKEFLISYDPSSIYANLDNMTKKLNVIENTIKSLMFGG